MYHCNLFRRIFFFCSIFSYVLFDASRVYAQGAQDGQTQQVAQQINVAWIDIVEGIGGNYKTYLNGIYYFAAKPEYHAVVVHINSGGGELGSAEIIEEALKDLRKLKPVVVTVGNLCASAAYLIASAADAIIAPEMSDVGCIGVILRKYVFTEFPAIKDSIFCGGKLESDYIWAGKYKDVNGDFFKKLSKNERAYIQDGLNQTYDIFCQHVAVNRGLPLEKRDQWADGKLFTGKRALELGLIDYVGSSKADQDDILRKLLAQRGKPVQGEIVYYFQKKD